ncbi:MAG: cell division protein FtsQ [Prevotellaceae bacterium]|nr:cell division protein FtsQ [Prevotellaceae bacterium]
MLRKIGQILALTVVAGYLVVAVTAFNRKPADAVCHDIVLVVKDSVNAGFITAGEVKGLLAAKGISPVGRPMDDILCQTLERELSKHPLIANVNCYKTVGNDICVEVSQRIPVLRVLPATGESYYIDTKGKVMPPDAKCVAYLPVATGQIEKTFATTDLYHFALFLQRNKFWNAQIEQINVLPDQTVELVPRVGNHILYLGKPDNYAEKLERAKRFYELALNKVGWNKYARISVEFDNQIVCTKRKD